MKRIVWLLFLTGLAVLTSCKQEVEDVFSQSASERIESEIIKYRELLLKPQHGWIMEYYPGGSNQLYGGYALTVMFSKDGHATFRSVLSDDVNTTSNGLYSLRKDVGPTLNFDTYNDLFHYFSDVDLGHGGGVGKGMLGDYEFMLASGSDTEIRMSGKKHGSVIRMYPLTEPAVDYLRKARSIRDSYIMIPATSIPNGTFGGQPVQVEMLHPQHFLLTQGKDQTKLSFMFTDKGAKLYQPVTLNGVTVETLHWDAQARVFTGSDGKASFPLVAKPFGLRLDQLLGDYVFSYLPSSNVTEPKTVDVKISQSANGRIQMTGLPFNVRLTYNTKWGALELKPQQLRSNPNVSLAIWEVGSYLNASGDMGLLTLWNGKHDSFELTFVENDFEWFAGGKQVHPNAFIIWNTSTNPGSVYTGFGDARYMKLKLTRKKQEE